MQEATGYQKTFVIEWCFFLLAKVSRDTRETSFLPSIVQGQGILRPWVLAQAWPRRYECCVKGQLDCPELCRAGKERSQRQVEHEISVPKGCTYSFIHSTSRQ